MVLAILVLGGGFVFWAGLLANRQSLAIPGGIALVIALSTMMSQGAVDVHALPFLLCIVLLAFLLKRAPPGIWRQLGWAVFIAVILALGFRLIPFFAPVAMVPTVEHLDRFPPEKVILMLLVPPMVLAPWSSRTPQGYSERSWWVSLLIFAGILTVVIPLGLITGFIAPGLTDQSAASLGYGLAYNLLYTSVLEESFFRGILQTALIGALRRTLPDNAASVIGIAVVGLLFGLTHLRGGMTLVALATLAGIGYGLVYSLTGRLHHAVFVHFGVNAIHRLAFSGT